VSKRIDLTYTARFTNCGCLVQTRFTLKGRAITEHVVLSGPRAVITTKVRR
jgi:hypothetical protein